MLPHHCTTHSDCPDTQACIQHNCSDPCSFVDCGANTICSVLEHAASCQCQSGYIGDSCFKVECLLSSDCPTDKYCNQETNKCSSKLRLLLRLRRLRSEKKKNDANPTRPLCPLNRLSLVPSARSLQSSELRIRQLHSCRSRQRVQVLSRFRSRRRYLHGRKRVPARSLSLFSHVSRSQLVHSRLISREPANPVPRTERYSNVVVYSKITDARTRRDRSPAFARTV